MGVSNTPEISGVSDIEIKPTIKNNLLVPKEKLMIFVKNEEAGKVKTRLAKFVGDEKALEIYGVLLRHTHALAAPLKVKKEVWYSRFIEENDLWSKGGFEKEIQEGESLGERMSAAFKKTFKEGFGKAVIIGSDCGELTQDVIRQAFLHLKKHDVVLGPAADGGYYLLGMNAYYPELFSEISWSTGQVLTQTLDKAKKIGVNTTLLQQLNDVDEIKDWELIKEKFEKSQA